jgi:hypothetical protein
MWHDDGAEYLTAPDGGRSALLDAGTGHHIIRDNSVFFAGIRLPAENGLEYREDGEDALEITEGDPLSAVARSARTCRVERGDWRTRVESSAVMTSTRTEFLVSSTIEAFEGDTRVFAKTWSDRFARDHL